MNKENTNNVEAAVKAILDKRLDWIKKRAERAMELGTPEFTNAHVAFVPSHNPERAGKTYYKVNIKRGHESCTCEDWIYRGRSNGIPCKHLLRTMAERDARQLTPDLEENMREADAAVLAGELPPHAPEHGEIN